MDKRIKRLATTTIVCVIVASIFGSVMVLASVPDLIFPQLIDVFVTNTSNDPVPVDVSGWLHTTQEDCTGPVWVTPSSPIVFFSKDTKGYREITIKFYIWEGADAEFEVQFRIAGPGGSTTFIVDEFVLYYADYGVVKTYAIQGSEIKVLANSLHATDPSRVILWYYMTT